LNGSTPFVTTLAASIGCHAHGETHYSAEHDADQSHAGHQHACISPWISGCKGTARRIVAVRRAHPGPCL
jgi:hypothetical protein